MKSYVLITGATGGLGKAFVTECAMRGYNLFLTDIRENSLEKLSYSIKNYYNVDVLYKKSDFLNYDSIKELWEYVANNKMKFHILINVAGLDFEGGFFEQDTEKLLEIMKINTLSVVEMTRNIVVHRDTNKKLRVINVSSLAGFYAMPLKATYSSSKAFITNLSLALTYELKEYNGTVTTLCPAGMPTREDCIKSIASQGFLGRVTTKDVGYVANKTISKALKGKIVYIPGVLNNILRILGGLMPKNLVAKLIHNRWKTTRQIAEMSR